MGLRGEVRAGYNTVIQSLGVQRRSPGECASKKERGTEGQTLGHAIQWRAAEKDGLM